MQRRQLVASGLAAGFAAATGLGLAGCAHRVAAHPKADKALASALAGIEKQSGGRMGIYVYDAVTGGEAGWRARERFPMCSTFKTLLAAHVLHLAQDGQVDLGRQVAIAQTDLVTYSPVTEKYAGQPGGMTVLELCEAVVVLSDNTAANLILGATGGPAALTAWLRREVSDKTTRLDRTEPSLNTAEPGDERDTTTPQAMNRTWQALLLGDVLKGYGRAMLQQWLIDSRTGDKRVRAGLPADWKAGGKTGSGAHATFGDTLIVWPNARSESLIISAYLTGGTQNFAQGDAVLAQAGAAIGQWYQQIQNENG
ncbi:class A beta-lactamase [Comamonas odontotermitis]|uniref:class A beta-lactamase n=1 Tax=Comamonas odontotermitis TaxID=379895 RepID=UPI003670B2C8